MDYNYSQPLPPGVQSFPSNSPLYDHLNPSTQHPLQPFQSYQNPQNPAGHFPQNQPFPIPLSQAIPHPHFRPPFHYNCVPHAPSQSYQTPTNFQNSNFVQAGMPLPQNTDFQSLQGVGHDIANKPVESNIQTKQEKESSVLHQDSADTPVRNLGMHLGTDGDIEVAVQDAVLREQEIAAQKIIQSQRQSRDGTGPPEDGTDIFSGRHDPNALKEHLLKMTTEHRAEMALKRGKPTVPEEENVEIGNGYGVPGGGAYNGARPFGATSSSSGVGNHEGSSEMPSIDGDSGKNAVAKDVPEYLKQRLRARGILKDKPDKDNSASAENASTFLPRFLQHNF